MEMEINGIKFVADVRRAYELKPVLLFPEKLTRDFDAYYMFRDVYRSQRDREVMLEHNYRYDITIIPPARIGDEYIKTFGHYHPVINNTGLSYTEIYEVLRGEGLYLLQRVEDKKVLDAIAIFAKEGDKIIIPPNYGHVTINHGEKPLEMANWVARDFVSIYEPFKKMRGACYYYTKKGWVANRNYATCELRIFERAPLAEKFGIDNKNMYDLIKTPGKLEFLIKPEKYLKRFEELYDIRIE
ncbi:glucose-6-phosphate isomerase [bacterium]|nr:glucose-6-phosphate isomerase [bacterium]